MTEFIQGRAGLFDMKTLAPRTEQQYDELVALLRMVLNAGGRHEGHPFAKLVIAIGDLIEEYEDVHYPAEDFV